MRKETEVYFTTLILQIILYILFFSTSTYTTLNTEEVL